MAIFCKKNHLKHPLRPIPINFPIPRSFVSINWNAPHPHAETTANNPKPSHPSHHLKRKISPIKTHNPLQGISQPLHDQPHDRQNHRKVTRHRQLQRIPRLLQLSLEVHQDPVRKHSLSKAEDHRADLQNGHLSQQRGALSRGGELVRPQRSSSENFVDGLHGTRSHPQCQL